jgi:hypothetical protein
MDTAWAVSNREPVRTTRAATKKVSVSTAALAPLDETLCERGGLVLRRRVAWLVLWMQLMLLDKSIEQQKKANASMKTQVRWSSIAAVVIVAVAVGRCVLRGPLLRGSPVRYCMRMLQRGIARDSVWRVCSWSCSSSRRPSS